MRGLLAALAAVALCAALTSCGRHDRAHESPPAAEHFPTIGPSAGIGGLGQLRPLVGTEAPIAQTTAPPISTLALAYQPTVRMSVLDRFWPVSVAGVLLEHDAHRYTCVVDTGEACVPGPPPPTFDALRAGATSAAYLDYPSALNDAQAQFEAYAEAAGLSPEAIGAWRTNPAGLEPFVTAQIYFYYGGLEVPAGAPVPKVQRRHLLSLEYWFFYPFNYFPAIVPRPSRMLVDPIGADHGNLDYHEGDWEHVTVLIDSASLKPRYLWMARHDKEGELSPWSKVMVDDSHPIVYPAIGGHPSYQRCGPHRRKRTLYFAADYVVCPPGLFEFLAARTPLVDLAHVAWGCWRGHFGKAGDALRTATGGKGRAGYLASGPLSPLRQADNKTVCRSD
jgi:hypothetical protein